jgi:hypothetical protein
VSDERNKRRQPRFVVEGLHGSLTFASEVEILNMSLSGVALRLERRLRIGAEYTLKLEIADKIVPVKGVIVWEALDERRKGQGGEDVLIYCAGMKFTDVITQRLMDLLSFIDQNKLQEEKRLGGLRFSIDAPGKALLDLPHPYHVKVISLRGMLAETDRAMQPEQRCPMEIALPDAEEPMRFLGRVAYVQETAWGDDTAFQVGVEFLDMSSEDRLRLDAFIRGLASR